MEVHFLMAKFKSSEKLKAVKQYLDGNESYKTIAKLIGVDNGVFQNWIRQYEYHGEKAFEKCYTTYDLQFKLDVLNYMYEQGTSIRETAAIFHIQAPSTIIQWKKQYETNGKDTLKLKKKGRPSLKKDNQNSVKKQEVNEGTIEALRAENERLRMENAYLKKLNALVQNKDKSPNKTRLK